MEPQILKELVEPLLVETFANSSVFDPFSDPFIGVTLHSENDEDNGDYDYDYDYDLNLTSSSNFTSPSPSLSPSETGCPSEECWDMDENGAGFEFG